MSFFGTPLGIAVLCFGILFLVAVVHELGHLFMLRRLGKKGIVSWEGGNLEVRFDALNLTDVEIGAVYLAGYYSGALVLLLFLAMPLLPWAFFILGLLWHAWLCRYDLLQLNHSQYRGLLWRSTWLFLGWSGLGVLIGVFLLVFFLR